MIQEMGGATTHCQDIPARGIPLYLGDEVGVQGVGSMQDPLQVLVGFQLDLGWGWLLLHKV